MKKVIILSVLFFSSAALKPDIFQGLEEFFRACKSLESKDSKEGSSFYHSEHFFQSSDDSGFLQINCPGAQIVGSVVEDKYVLEVLLKNPVDKESLKIEKTGETITFRGKFLAKKSGSKNTQEEKESKSSGLKSNFFEYKEFEKIFKIPENAGESKVDAADFKIEKNPEKGLYIFTFELKKKFVEVL